MYTYIYIYYQDSILFYISIKQHIYTIAIYTYIYTLYYIYIHTILLYISIYMAELWELTTPSSPWDPPPETLPPPAGQRPGDPADPWRFRNKGLRESLWTRT